jgi:AcrR family transcriptional regulator
MRVKPRQTENAAATRAALMRVARKLFSERGFANTGTEEIVKRARVTRGALYHHFRDKQDLFKAVLHDEEQRLAFRIGEAGAGYPDVWSGFVAGCRAFLDACLEPAVRQIILIDGLAVLGVKEFREVEESYYLSGLRETLSVAIETGIIDRQPVDVLAHMLIGALNEAGISIANADDKDTARADATKAVERLLNGLKVA